MGWLRNRRLERAVQSAHESLEPYVYYPGCDAQMDDVSAARGIRLASIQDDLGGNSARDAVHSDRARVGIIREIAAIARDLPGGNERQDLIDAADDLYRADTSVTWIVLNDQLGQALAAPAVAGWLEREIAPDTTDPLSADEVEVREMLAETFADLVITDLSEGQQRDVVLGQLELDADRVDRWVETFLEDVWFGEPPPTVPPDVRMVLTGELLSRLGRH